MYSLLIMLVSTIFQTSSQSNGNSSAVPSGSSKVEYHSHESPYSKVFNGNVDIGDFLYNNYGVLQIAYCGKNDEIVLVVDHNNEVYRSADNGRTFLPMNDILKAKAQAQVSYDSDVRIEEVVTAHKQTHLVLKGLTHLNFFSTNCGLTVKPILYDRRIHDLKMHTNKKFILASAFAPKDDLKEDALDEATVRMDLFLSHDFGDTWHLVHKYIYSFEWLYDKQSLRNHSIMKRVFGHLTKHEGKVHPMGIMVTYDLKGSGHQNYHFNQADSVATVVSNDFFKTETIVNRGRMYLEKTSSFIINFNLSEVGEQGDDRADTFDVASGMESFGVFRRAKFPYYKPLDIKIHESFGQMVITGSSSDDNELGMDLFVSAHHGDEFTRIAKNVVNVLTDFTADGVMLVNSHNLYGNLERFAERNIDNERRHKDNQKKLTLKEKTFISYNNGADYERLKNVFDQSGEPICSITDCSLHLHLHKIKSSLITRGVIVASGNTGSHLLNGVNSSDTSSTANLGLYVSSDAGNSFHKVLDGNYAFEVSDYGSLIIAASSDKYSDDVFYSLNYGKAWIHLKLKEPLKVKKFYTDSSNMSKSIFAIGAQEDFHGEVLVALDFGAININTCRGLAAPSTPESDYESIQFHHDGNTCMNGSEQTIIRRRPEIQCQMEEHRHFIHGQPCVCTDFDYTCDFGYEKDSGSGHCVEIPRFVHKLSVEEQCKREDYYVEQTGYKKIPFNKCVGGVQKGVIRRACSFSLFSVLHVIEYHYYLYVFVFVLLVGTLYGGYVYYDKNKHKNYFDMDLNGNSLNSGSGSGGIMGFGKAMGMGSQNSKDKDKTLEANLYDNFELDDEKQKLW